MRQITLAAANLQVSDICLGTGGLGGDIDETASFALLDRYMELGGNFLDTAHVYNNWIPGERSRSEKVIGRWMRARSARPRIVLATKGGHPELDRMSISRLSPAEIITDLDESLRYLQTDCIDLYWLHRDDPSRQVEEIIDTLATQVRAGKIRAYGASNWRSERLRQAQNYAARSDQPPFLADQVLWNAAKIDFSRIPDQTIHYMDPALFEYHLESNLPAIPYTSQANGLFDKMDRGVLDVSHPGSLAPYILPENLARLKVFQSIRQETGYTLTQIVLAFLLSQPFPTIPIIGPRNVTQLEASLTASGLRLSPIHLERILQAV